MIGFNITTKAPQVLLRKNNKGIRCTLCYAAVLLGIAALLIGCPDTTGNGNGDNNGDSNGDNNGDTLGTPTEATLVQNATIATIGATTATLTWSAPTDTAGYEGVLISWGTHTGTPTTPQPVAAGIQSFTITELTAATSHVVIIQTQYTLSGKNNATIIDVVTVPNTAVQHITVSAINTTVLTLTWQNPVDTTGYTEVLIDSDPPAGNITTLQSVAPETNTFAVTGLTAGTTYTYAFATIYNGDQTGSRTTITAETLTAASIDSDADTLIDITSLERLHNIRYTLDGSSYKTSSTDPGSQCGSNGTTACTGYELTRSLDFTDAASYDSNMVNAAWRPQDSNGAVLPQALADDGTNSGWDPIGTDATIFNSRFEGNGHTIYNLYGRLSTAGRLGLFGAAGTSSVIRSIGVASVRLYGSDDADFIGALAGSSTGTIVASYASGAVNGGGGDDFVGGLVGQINQGAIVASYASTTVSGGSDADTVGGLMGEDLGHSRIIASYASGTADGDAGDDFVGGLTGSFILSAIIASYASGTADGGADSGIVGSIGVNSGSAFTASYGFGTAIGENSDGTGNSGIDGTARMDGVAAVGDGIVGARTLTSTNAGPEWDQASSNTMDAWDFGTASQAPVLKYADYDGAEDTYGCIDATTPTSTATIVIPSIVATPTGPMTIICGTTHLPEQVR